MACRAADLIILARSCCWLAGARELALPAERAPAADSIRSRPTPGSAATTPRPASSWTSRKRSTLRAFTLADPYRVVSTCRRSTSSCRAKTGEAGRGLVKAFRFGLVMQGGSRIVHRCHQAGADRQGLRARRGDGQPARLVLDLAATDRDSFMRTIAAENRAGRRGRPARSSPTPQHSGDPRPIDRARSRPWRHRQRHRGRRAARWKRTSCCDFATDAARQARKVRQIPRRDDAHRRHFHSAGRSRAHGAHPPGARCSSRSTPTRCKKSEGDAQGATIYTLSETASDAEAARLAESENRADVIAGVDLSHEPDDVADILIDLAQRETKTFSLHFARDRGRRHEEGRPACTRTR